MVEARDVGHDRLLVRTGSAHNVCGGEERRSGGRRGRRGGRGEEGGGREEGGEVVKQITEHR